MQVCLMNCSICNAQVRCVYQVSSSRFASQAHAHPNVHKFPTWQPTGALFALPIIRHHDPVDAPSALPLSITGRTWLPSVILWLSHHPTPQIPSCQSSRSAWMLQYLPARATPRAYINTAQTYQWPSRSDPAHHRLRAREGHYRPSTAALACQRPEAALSTIVPWIRCHGECVEESQRYTCEARPVR